ncbi:MAG: AAA family ATPase [Candidatus Eremiobacteraeota bacterium]|nr:AAA family ATPase [Candidatus Eremiobacteraeota bacterium]
MKQKFRLFVQKHENGTYTVTLPGIHYVPVPIDDAVQPASSSLSSYGPILEEVKDDVRIALEKWLARVDPSHLAMLSNHRPGETLEKVEVELRPSDSRGKKRHDRVKLTVSLMVTPEEGSQLLVSAPKLASPPLSFYCYSMAELREAATREIAAYFSSFTLEEILPYCYQRQEFLDEIEVAFTPMKPFREKKEKEQDEGCFWALRGAGINLSARTRENRLLKAYGREREVNELMAVLSSERSSSVLLVGESGTGKTAVAHEVVRRITAEQCPPALRKRQVWHTSAGSLIAGCSYIGEWQEKVQNIVEEVKKKRHILHIDDIVGLLEAGRWSKSDENIGHFLKNYLADGTVVIIGETTPGRLSIGERYDPSFFSLFRIITMAEPDENSTLSILGNYAASLENDFRVRIRPSASEAALELTRRFQPYLSLPGKAVGLLERVASDAGKTGARERPEITRQFIVSAFARETGLPEFILSDHLTLEPKSIDKFFSEQIKGQGHAVGTIVDLVTVIKSGLNDPQKPMGCLFFVGPTGVGKTEMAKTLAEYLFGSRERLVRFDMSEYAEPFNVAKLIGSPHGDEEGELIRRIRLQPFSVVLLDEFEKAHGSIFDCMLQVLGEGRLTDAKGRTADFRSAIIIMTSNLGATAKEQRKPGLRRDSSMHSVEEHFRDQVEHFFRPEFVNRLDGIVVFHPLGRAAMEEVASRELAKLLEREGITRRSLLVEVDPSMMELLIEKGFSPHYGARPLKREIERSINVPLAHYLVSHRISSPYLIGVSCEDGRTVIHATALSEARQVVKQEEAPLSLSAATERKMQISELVEGFAEIRLRLHRWLQSDNVERIRIEWKRLLAETRKKEFRSDGREGMKAFERIYQLERLTKRLEQLADRASYLEEFATLTKRQRDARYGADLAQNYTDLCRDADFLEIELLCAHLSESGRALMHLSAIGQAVRGERSARERAEWVAALAKMYLSWAGRKGYESGVMVRTGEYVHWIEEKGLKVKAHIPDFRKGPPMEPCWTRLSADSLQGLFKRIEELEASELGILIEGTNVYGFLKGEAGTHKLVLRGEERGSVAPFRTVAAAVDSLDDKDSPADLLNAREALKGKRGEKKKGQDVPDIIRIYSPLGDRFVRDVRTGVRTTQVSQVLEGFIDEFILAHLRSLEAGEAWDVDEDAP